MFSTVFTMLLVAEPGSAACSKFQSRGRLVDRPAFHPSMTMGKGSQLEETGTSLPGGKR
jgi:hypothetical protein